MVEEEKLCRLTELFRNYPLMPVSPPIPLMNHFWVKAKRISSGTTTTADAAMTSAHSVPYAPSRMKKARRPWETRK